MVKTSRLQSGDTSGSVECKNGKWHQNKDLTCGDKCYMSKFKTAVPQDGNFLKSEIIHGDKRKMECGLNYVTNKGETGEDEMQCENGKWKDSSNNDVLFPVCPIKVCSKLTQKQMADNFLEPIEFPIGVGNEYHFKCNDNYFLVDRYGDKDKLSRICQARPTVNTARDEAAYWSHDDQKSDDLEPFNIPSCAKGCLEPNIANANLPGVSSYSWAVRDSEGQSQPAILVVSCHPGHSLFKEGNLDITQRIEIRCDKDPGVQPAWKAITGLDPSRIECKKDCPPLKFNDTNVIMTFDAIRKLSESATVQLSCVPGQELKPANKQRQCVNGNWSPNSEEVKCVNQCHKDGLNVPNAMLIPALEMGTEYYSDGTIVLVNCTAGYQAKGLSKYVCRENPEGVHAKWEPVGNLSEKATSCDRMCKKPQVAIQGTLNPLLAVPNLDYYGQGEEVTVTCINTYNLQHASQSKSVTAKCQQTGNFEPSLANIGCDKFCTLKALDKLIPDNKQKQDFALNEAVSFNCIADFSAKVNKMESTCTQNDWAPPIGDHKCYPNCNKPDIKASFSPDMNTYEYGDKITVKSCIEVGAALVGVKELTCENGKWSPAPPDCNVRCVRPSASTFSSLDPDEFEYKLSEEVLRECAEGYYTNKGMDSMKSTCKEGGKWSEESFMLDCFVGCDAPLPVPGSNTIACSHQNQPCGS